MKTAGFILIIAMVLIVGASVANSAFSFYEPPEKFSGYLIGRGGAQPFARPANSQPTVPSAPSPQPVPSGAERTIQLGVKNYGYYFPESGSGTITVKKGQKIKFEGILEGPEKLVGCMKSIRTPWGTKVFKPGDNTFSFTADRDGLVPFTCGMGMAAGTINIAA